MKQQQPFAIPAEHPVFAGHFPGMPIVPGVMLLDAAVFAIMGNSEFPGAWQITTVKFLSPLQPDEQAVISWEVQDNGAHFENSIRFDIATADRIIASGSLSLEQSA
jgi:3-hydroxyacyl-[acyl-carrier-protein] dehydratase